MATSAKQAPVGYCHEFITMGQYVVVFNT